MWQNDPQILSEEVLSTGLVLWKLGDSGPGALAGCAHQSEDLLKLVFVCGAREERAAGVHFSHDTAGGPNVDAGVVGTGAEKYVGRSIPECDDFIGKGVDRYAERTG